MLESAFQVQYALNHSTGLHVLTLQTNIPSTGINTTQKEYARGRFVDTLVLSFPASLHLH